ncbi:MAG: ATP-binding protein, partial [Spirochaetota bacterium]
IYEDSNDIVWVGTGSGGLHRYDREKDYFISYPYDLNDPELLPNPYNPCIYEDSSGTFWVSSYGGSISIFDREKEKVEKTYYHNPDDPNSIPRNQQVRVILEDKDNPDILWLAGHECGVIKFNKKKDTFKLYGVVPDNPNSLSNYWIYDMYDDGRGNLWVPTQYGLNKLDKKNETFTHYYYEPNNPMSISSNQIFGVFEDSSGFLWFATGGGGLNKFDRETEKFEHFSLENGFPANDVRTVLEDDNGYLWIGSGGNGLIKFNPEDKTYNIYGTDDGLQGNTFFESSKLKTKDGEFWFGGVNGCNRFYPEDIKDNKYIPPVFLTSFKQRGKDVNFDKAIEYMNEIELNWNNNFFSFEMIALNYTKPEKNKYAYYLEGLEEEWNYIDTRRFGNYTSLPTGNYILRIKASNNDGVWNEEGISVNINVIPPFWNTWWFIALCIIAGILLILTIYYLRITNIKKNEEKLSGLVNERTQELSKAKEELEIAYEEMEQSNEELINTNEELEQTVVQLRETQEVLIIQEKMASLGNLVAGVAHEINTPIGIGITASSHLDEKTREYNEIHKSRELKPEELDKFLDMLSRTSKIILSNLTRAAGMIKSFKQVAVDQTNENKRIFNLKRYIEDDILLSLRPELKKTKHKINVNCEEDLEINSYPSAYYQIISNLVLNSIIHGFEDIKIGEINIDVTKKENNIILEYRDNGKGIDENIITKIFDPFFTTKRGVGGTGLGLNIVYNTVTQTLKGTIECYNLDEKNGVKFTLYIPI